MRSDIWFSPINVDTSNNRYHVISVSYQSTVENVMTLRRGVELVSEELQYQPNNDAISVSFNIALRCLRLSFIHSISNV